MPFSTTRYATFRLNVAFRAQRSVVRAGISLPDLAHRVGKGNYGVSFSFESLVEKLKSRQLAACSQVISTRHDSARVW